MDGMFRSPINTRSETQPNITLTPQPHVIVPTIVSGFPHSVLVVAGHGVTPLLSEEMPPVTQDTPPPHHVVKLDYLIHHTL